MGISKITRNFKVMLSRDVRDVKRLEVGNYGLFMAYKGKVTMDIKGNDVIKQAAGIWAGLKETGVEYQKRVRKGWRKRSLSW